MPGKRPLRQMLFRQRGASVATISPDDWSPVPPAGISPLKSQPAPLGSMKPSINHSWNNSEGDDDNGRGCGGGSCNAEQRERLGKCQKSLEQLEFSLNNLLLSMSLASNSHKNQRRMAEADKFMTDLVDSIRANRTMPRRRRPPNQTGRPQTSLEFASEARKRQLEDESRALWRAQHIGAKCEDTVDRYMLDVVVGRLGEMAAAPAEAERCRTAKPSESPACGKCGGAVGKSKSSGIGGGGANKHNSCCNLVHFSPGDRPCRGRRRTVVSDAEETVPDASADADGSIRFPKRIKPNFSLLSARRDCQQLAEQQQHRCRNSQRQPRRRHCSGSSSDSPAAADIVSADSCQHLQHQNDSWTLRTWQPPGGSGSNNNNCFGNSPSPPPPLPPPPPPTAQRQKRGRRASELVSSVASYRRDSRRYEKALRVAAYLRDMCRQFYRTACSGRAPPAAHALEAILVTLGQLVAMRDRAVALAVRCTACPALCAAERLSSPQLCRLRGLLRLACTTGDSCGGDGGGGHLDLTEALAAADQSSDRCKLLRQLRLVATQADGPDADYRRLINALASFTELGNCATNYAAHRRRMCGTAPELGPGPRGITRADMRALALDLSAAEAEAAAEASAACATRGGRQRCGRRRSPLGEALHNPEEMRRRLRMHKYATGASLAVKADEGFNEP